MNKQQELQSLAAKHNERLINTASETIKGLHKDLVESITNPVLPEDVFIEYFLDYFRSPQEYDSPVLLYKWMELAGGPFGEVDIIDPDGVVLYTVPSIYSTPDIDRSSMDKYRFDEISSKYAMVNKITSAKAADYLRTALSGISDNMSSDTKSHAMKWNAVLDRYSNKDGDESVSENTNKPSVDLGIFDM